MIDIKQLLFFKACVEEGSLSQAANKLKTSQPNVSKTISSLEKSIGSHLLERTGRGVVPTEAGRKVMDYARIILSTVNQLEAIPLNKEKIVLRISSTFNLYISHKVLEYLNLHSTEKYECDYWEGNYHHVIYRVEKNDSSIGFLHLPEKNLASFNDLMNRKGLAFKVLGYGREALFVGPANPFYDTPSITKEEIRKLKLVVRKDYGYDISEAGDPYFLSEDRYETFTPVFVTNSSEAIRNQLETTDFAHPGYFIDQWKTPLNKVRCLIVEEGEKVAVGCIYKKDIPLSPELEDFLSWL